MKKPSLKRLCEVFLSDTLLIGFAVFQLFLFILILIAPGHAIGVEEPNLVILSVEIAICIFAIVWATLGVVRSIKRMRTL